MVTVAYFSMEIGLDPGTPTYAGGLGILAGDTLRGAADLGVPMVAMTLLHRRGYFRQHLDAWGNQTETPELWTPEEILEPLTPRVTVTLEGRRVQVRAWRHLLRGISGHAVPIYFLDTVLPENSPWDQTLTDQLYGGDDHYRLCQEVILGLGGAAMLPALGLDTKIIYHMNEGHSALLALALLEWQMEARGGQVPTAAAVEAVRQQCVFTTHTSVAAGHDQFPWKLAQQVLGPERATFLKASQRCLDSNLNMTCVALHFSRYINGVARRHAQISRDLFPAYPIDAISNGVHALTWAAPSLRELYDRHIPTWRQDNSQLCYAMGVPFEEIQQAHAESKRQLLAEVERRTGVRLDERVMTLGFARRATAYKRPDLLFSDLDRLKRIDRQVGPVQIIYGGKAHPRDEGGKAMIRHIFQAAAALEDTVPVVYLENYDLALGQLLCAGVDLWLNTPLRPQEASGTSGMKAALNGVPSLSVLDGWWIEGHVENVTGWCIGDGREPPLIDYPGEVVSLYDKLEQVIVPLFYRQPHDFARIRRSTIALNGSFFNTHRMVSQYVAHAYAPIRETTQKLSKVFPKVDRKSTFPSSPACIQSSPKS